MKTIKILNWLEREVHGKKIFVYILGCLILHFGYMLAITKTFELFDIQVPKVEGDKISILTWYFPILLLGLVFMEELAFRFPLFIAVEKWGVSSKVIVFAMGLSMIFGICHGGIGNIFTQGVNGLFLSILFLKCGGFQGKFLKPLLVTITAHIIWNATIVLIIFSQGITEI